MQLLGSWQAAGKADEKFGGSYYGAGTSMYSCTQQQLTIIKITGMIFHPGNEITTKIRWAVDGSVHIKVNGVEMYPSKKETRKG